MNQSNNQYQDCKEELNRLRNELESTKVLLSETINDKKNLEHQLIEAQNNSFYANSNIFNTFKWNIETGEIQLSSKALKIFDLTDQDKEISEDKLFASASNFTELKRQISNVINGITSEVNCEVLFNTNNTCILFEGVVTKLDSLKKPIEIFGTLKNITQLKKLEFERNERIKELNCIYSITEKISEHNKTLQQLLQEIAELMPLGWQHPDHTYVRLTFKDAIYQSSNFCETNNLLETDIVLNSLKVGKIEVFTKDIKPMPPFLDEEKKLLSAIALRLGMEAENKMREDETKAFNHKYQTIVSNLNEIIYEIDATGKITYISPAIKKVLGYTPKQVLGKKIGDFSKQAAALGDSKIEALAKETSLVSEYEIVDAHGRQQWIKVSSQAIFDNNEFVGATGILSVITEQKKSEIELHKSNALFTSILSASPDAIAIAELDGTITFVSDSNLKMFKAPSVDVFKKQKIFNFIHPDQRPKAIEAISLMFQGIYSGAAEYTGICFDGTTIDIEANAELIKDVNGIPIQLVLIIRDITEKKRAQDIIRQIDAKHKRLIENINDVIYEISPSGIIYYVSPQSQKTVGYTPDELLGQNFLKFVHKDDIKALEKKLDNLKTGEPQHIEFRFSHKDGHHCWVKATSTPIIVNGELLGAAGSLAEITLQKQAIDTIKNSENRFRSLIENAPDGLVLVGENDRIKYASPAARKIFGYSETDNPEEIDQVASTHPEDLPLVLETLNTILTNPSEIKTIQYRFSDKVGQWHWIESTFSNLLSDPNINAILINFRDITEKKNNEIQLIKLTRAVEQSPVSIVITNLEGNIEYANPKACQTTGYTINELIGQNPRVLKSGESNPEDYSRLWKTISQGQEWHGIFHNKRKNGELYWESSTISPIYNLKGEIINYIAVKEDITEQKRMQEELLESEIRFQQIAEQSHTVVWEVDANGLFTYVSPVATNSWGYKPDELVGILHFYDIHPQQGKEDFITDAFKYFDRKEPFVDFENRIQTKEGKIIWVSTNGVPIINPKGNLKGYRGADNDITEKKNWSLTLQQSEQELNEAQQIAKMGSWEFNLKTGNATWSKNYYRLVEMEERDSSLPQEDFMSMVHPDDLHFFKIDNDLLIERKTISFDHRLNLPTGKTIWVNNIIQPIFENNELVKLKGVNIDITEKKKAEEKIKEQNEKLIAIVNTIPDLMFVLDKDGTYLEYFVNDKSKLVLDSDKIIGNNIKNFFDNETALVHQSYIDYCINQQALTTFEYSLVINGKKGNFEARLSPMGKTKVLAFVRDITEKKQKDEELKKLSLAIEQSPVSVVITDLEANIEYVNPAFINATGYNLNELIGNNTKILKSGNHPQEIYKQLWETITSGKIWQGELINKKKNGDTYWESTTITPIQNNKGQTTNYLAVKQDITQRKIAEKQIIELNASLETKITQRTAQLAEANIHLLTEIEERKRIEEALSESEKSYRTVVENINEVIFQIDVDGNWLFLNKSWEVITGFSIAESLGKPFLSFVHPDDREQNLMHYDVLMQRTKDACRHHVRYLTKEGNFRWIEVFAKLGLNDQNETIGTYGTLQDITERKLAEEALHNKTAELENFFTVGLDLLCIADTSGHFLKINKAWEDLLGYASEDLLSKQFLDFVHPDDIQSTLNAMAKLTEQNPVHNFINRYRAKDGSYKFIEWRSVPVGHVIYAAARDITERKRAEEFENELLRLSPKLTGIPYSEINAALKLAISQIGKFLNADRSYIFEFDAHQHIMNNTHEWVNEGINAEMDNLQDVPCEVFPEWMAAINQHETIDIPKVNQLPDSWKAEKEILEAQGIQSVLIMPLLSENQVIGFVGLDSVKSERTYSNTEINILKVWSSMLASLINNQRSEKLLEQTRQNYETFFNTIDDFLWVLDEEGHIIHTNNTVINRLGFPFDELQNESLIYVHPEERHNDLLNSLSEMIDGFTDLSSIPLRTKNGSLIPVETKIKKGYWNGQAAIFGVSKDISKILVSEQKFATAFQSNSAMMAISKQHDGQYIDVNNAFVEVMGFSRDELIGNTNANLKLFEDPNLRQQIIDNLNNNQPVRKLEISMRTKSGEIKTGLLSADTIYVGNEKCLLTVTMDISERKKAELEISNARREAEQANAAKSEFLSRMSHELRTPMNSILGFAQLLEMGDLNPKQRKGVNHIMRSGKHLLDLINEVLDISRIEAGRLTLSIEPVEVKPIIEEMLNVVYPLANPRRIRLTSTLNPDNRFYVKSDRQRLKQVLLNLLNNAIKYNQTNGTVSISAQHHIIQNNDFIRIAITDTGIGIANNDIVKLFKPFERIGAEKTETEGTGLGLSVVKKLMEAMGGFVGVESELGHGSVFYLDLPMAESPLQLAGDLSGIVELETVFHEKRGAILYIEDNASNIDLVEQILSTLHTNIHLVCSEFGGNAVNLAIQHQPNLILLDLDLPDIHGSEVLRQLQTNSLTSNIPVVVISADAMPSQISKLLQNGAKDYLTKPLDLNSFLSIIDTFVKS